MKTTTKLFALGLLGAGVYAALRGSKSARQAMPKAEGVGAFDTGDLDNPVIVTEEVVVVTEAIPIDAELVDEQGELRSR